MEMDATTNALLNDLDFAANTDSGMKLSREACAHLSHLLRRLFGCEDAPVLPLLGKVTEDSGTNFTIAEITGPTRMSIEKAAEKYLRDFSPMGYSTRILVNPHEVKDAKGYVWTMKMSRYTSCE
jgi:hypothetical protein